MFAERGHVRDAGWRALQGRQGRQYRIPHGIRVHDQPEHDSALFLPIDTGYLVDVEGETHIAPGKWLDTAKSRGENVCNGNRFCENGSHVVLLQSPHGSREVRQYGDVLANHETTLSAPSVAYGFEAVKAALPAVEIKKLHASLESKQ